LTGTPLRPQKWRFAILATDESFRRSRRESNFSLSRALWPGRELGPQTSHHVDFRSPDCEDLSLWLHHLRRVVARKYRFDINLIKTKVRGVGILLLSVNDVSSTTTTFMHQTLRQRVAVQSTSQFSPL